MSEDREMGQQEVCLDPVPPPKRDDAPTDNIVWMEDDEDDAKASRGQKETENPGMELLKYVPPEPPKKRGRTSLEHSTIPLEIRRQLEFVSQFLATERIKRDTIQ